MGFIKYQYNKLLAKKYYNMTGFDLFNPVKFADYFNEYAGWVGKLNLPKELKVLDVGSDYGSLYYYLKWKGFKLNKYNPYDYLIFKPFTVDDIKEFYDNYNFIKVDCEGCEFEIFKYVDMDKIKDKILAIAIHENKLYNINIAQKITTICPYQIFKIGIETIYTNSLRVVD